MRIDPWSSETYDLARLRDEFGIEPIEPVADRLAANRLVERGIVFGHRGMGRVARAVEHGDPWALMTGLMPSGPMHLGHKMVIDQILYYQELGADVFVGVADIEAYATRGLTMEQCRRLAVEEYLVNYIAMGLKPDDCQVYFQSKRSAVKDLAWQLGKRVNWSEMESIYGFAGDTNMGHVLAPLVQVGDILHVQLDAYGGPRPTVVPVGIDQDPHIRLTRDLAQRSRLFNATRTRDGRIGVFVKVDADVEALLEAAKAELKREGFLEFETNVPYKALYLPGASEDDLAAVDEATSRVEVERRRDAEAGVSDEADDDGPQGTGFLPPAATYHTFMPGLTGGKMSSSRPETAVFLGDDWKSVQAKIKHAKTNGLATAKEQREHGAEPEGCVIYEHFRNHFARDDDELRTVWDECKAGDRLCGECKGHLLSVMEPFHTELAEKREQAKERVGEYLRED